MTNTRLEAQIRELSPSVKDALFRRLTFAEDLAWLRDEKKKGTVIGFEVDLDGQELSGFALIAIQRHTVVAFVSDRDESPRLILFPALDTLFDPGFELLDLMVTRKEFKDAKFDGVVTGHGRFGDMVIDLTPPNRRVDIAENVLDQIASIIKHEEDDIQSIQQPTPASTPISTPAHAPISTPVEPEIEEEPPYENGPPEGFEEEPDNFDNYEEPGYYDDYSEPDYQEEYEPESEPKKELSRSDKLKLELESGRLSSLSEVIDFVVVKLGVNRPLAVTLANKAMQSNVSPQYRVQLAVNIFCKLMDENKI